MINEDDFAETPVFIVNAVLFDGKWCWPFNKEDNACENWYFKWGTNDMDNEQMMDMWGMRKRFSCHQVVYMKEVKLSLDGV